MAFTIASFSTPRQGMLHHGVPVASRTGFCAAVPCQTRIVTPRRHQFRQYAKEKEPGMVPDYNEPDKDLVPADGGLLDFIMNKWLVKPSPTRSIVLNRQQQMNDERKQKSGGDEKPLWEGLLKDDK
eukprot:CAMPEP_0185260472 /NCGR_PEP_ID=MMETSP1359-20130426/9057_1 /TAXON_ID=552665 /ORGANISM="Bigelowiella longifila, Strain CCMP242" /LENGTH=125 /DNA_ID=CAMNT_0027846741 /DNA_START=95 /DNA_END=472 /DNA_ORIENTATION=-